MHEYVSLPVFAKSSSVYSKLQRFVSGSGHGLSVCVYLALFPLTQSSTFEYVRDAEDAMYALDRYRFLNRELDIQFAEGDRKSKLPFKFCFLLL